MAGDLRRIEYTNTRSSNYMRSYANASYVTVNSNNDVVIDFCEEYVPPNLVTSQQWNGSGFHPSYEHNDSGILHLTREFKHSIIINREQALQLANYLHSFLGIKEEGK